jgi:hypothetical protein
MEIADSEGSGVLTFQQTSAMTFPHSTTKDRSMVRQIRNAIGVAAMMLAPLSVSAQDSWTIMGTLDITGRPLPQMGVQYNSVGGGHRANFTVEGFEGGNRTFTDFIIWCIDAGRSITVPGSYSNYTLYTLKGFDESGRTSQPRISGGVSFERHDPDLGDMRAIASLADQLADNYGTWDANRRRTWQDGIWARFDGVNPQSLAPYSPQSGNPNFGGNGWYVLSNNRDQTFIVEVPEPGTGALLVVGSLLMFAVLRRRVA